MELSLSDSEELAYGAEFDDMKMIEKIFISEHRWYNLCDIIIQNTATGKFYVTPYMDPSTEEQEGQDRFHSDPVIWEEIESYEETITFTKYRKVVK